MAAPLRHADEITLRHVLPNSLWNECLLDNKVERSDSNSLWSDDFATRWRASYAVWKAIDPGVRYHTEFSGSQVSGRREGAHWFRDYYFSSTIERVRGA
jgi:hypothetical protein